MTEALLIDVAKDKGGIESTSIFMDGVVEKSPLTPSPGDLVEGKVITLDRMSVYIDLGICGTGVIYGREYLNARDLIKKVHVGDTIKAKVVETENKDGNVELSLREAKQAVVWTEAEDKIRSKEQIELTVKDANKGGLLLEWQGILGFLPASQLNPDHYPRVEDGDKEKIYEELKHLVGEKFSVSIITADPSEGKLIFSEKNQDLHGKQELIEKYQIGDIVDGEVTGAVDFGIFIKIEDGLEGLVHISEIDWSLVEDPRELFHVGEKVKAKIIEIKDSKISLSIKTLKENPWVKAEHKYAKGSSVKGVVIKYNKFGALVSIEEGVAGLIHISEFASEEELREKLELGKTYDFVITLFESKEQRMTLVIPRESTTDEKPESVLSIEDRLDPLA